MNPKDLLQRSAVGHTGSAISVVNAIPAGKGSTIGIEMECAVYASFKEGKEKFKISNKAQDHHGLVSKCAELALARTGFKIPKGVSLVLRVDSKIPQAVGLKSSSAVSTAAVEAIYKLVKVEPNPQSILETSCKASKLSGASLTGAYDDAAACLLGGLVLSDNTKFRIAQHTKVPKQLGSLVAIMIPHGGKKFTSDVKRESYRKFRQDSLDAFDCVRKGDVTSAMLLNSMVQCSALGYPFAPVSDAIAAGATAAGVTGKGPAVAALCSLERQLDRVKKAWKDLDARARILTTRIVQPTKLFEK